METVEAIAGTGAAGIAGIGLFADEHLSPIVESIRLRFDSVKSGQ
jgi:hypothetical protein